MNTAYLEKITKDVKKLNVEKFITKRNFTYGIDIIKKKLAVIDDLLLEEGSKKFVINLKLEKLYNFYLTIEFNPFYLYSCSCGTMWYPKRKVCIHAAILLIGFNQEYFTDNEYIDSDKVSSDITLAQDKTSIEKVREIVNTKLLSEFDIPETIVTVLDELDQIITIFLENGSQRISHTTLEWLNTLIIRVHTHKLIKIEKSLKKLQTTFVRYLEKSVVDDSVNLLSVLTEIHNYILLTRYLLDQNSNHPYLPTIAILGQARSEYFPVDDIKQCLLLGIAGWISDSGMVGVTAYFITFDNKDDISENFFTASNVRPIQNLMDKSPLMLYGFKTFSDVAFKNLAERSLYSLKNVKFNQNKNLSLHKNLDINPININLNDIKINYLQKITYSDWIELLNKIQNKPLFPIDQHDNSNLFILEPSRYVSFELDYITQRWKAPLIDINGKIIYLVVPNETAPHIANKIKNFQLMFEKEKLPNAIFGQLDFLEDEIVFHPISGWFYQGFQARGKYGSTVTRINYNFDVDIGAEYIFS